MAIKRNNIELQKLILSRQTLITLTRWRGSILVLGVILLVVMGAFLNSLLRLPTRTPLLIVSSTYQAPWDINPWDESNVGLLRKLGDHAFRVKSIEAAGRTITNHWLELEDAVSQLDKAAHEAKPILIYFNLHGVVDFNEKPCLIYRDSLPLATESWIPLTNILQSIENALSKPRDIVFLLESSRLEAPWQTHSEFPNAVQNLFSNYPRSGKIRSLSGICTTHPTPFENIGNEAGDRFTRLLALGLSGQCDQRQYGGNGNRHIEILELQSYIEKHFSDAKRAGAHVAANTKLLVIEPSSSPLAWAGISNPFLKIDSTESNTPQPDDRFYSLWRDVKNAGENRVWIDHPAYWSLLKQTAINLEAMLHSYNPDPNRLAELQRTFDHLKTKCFEPVLPTELSPDIFLKEQIQQSLNFWMDLSLDQNATDLRKKLEHWELVREESWYHPAPFLKALTDETNSKIFQRSDLLKSFAKGMVALERARLLSLQLPNLTAYEAWEKVLDARRRILEDHFLADLSNSQITETLNSFERECADLETWTRSMVSSIDHYYESLAELIPLTRACLILDSFESRFSTPASKSPMSDLQGKLQALIKSLADNTELLTNHTLQSDLQHFIDVGFAYQEVRELVATKWASILGEGQSLSEENSLVIAQLLSSGFLPDIDVTPNTTNSIRQGSYRALRNHAAARPTNAGNGFSPSNKFEKNHLPDLQSEICKLLNPLYAHVFQGLVPTNIEESHARLIWRELQRLHGSGSVRVDGSIIQQSIAARLLTSQFGLTDCAKWVHTYKSRLEERRASIAIQRCLDDFWNMAEPNGTPHFLLASEAIKKKIEQLPIEPSPFTKQCFANITLYQQAAERFRLSTRYLPASTSDLAPRLTWCLKNETDQLPFTFGTGTIKLLNVKKDIQSLIEQKSVAGNIDQNGLLGDFSLANRLDPTSNNKIRVLFDYRGHQCENSLVINDAPKLVSVVSSSPIGDASIRIEELGNTKRYRTLILDCSASMFEAYDLESTPSSIPGSLERSKLYAAKRAVAEILERWCNQPNQVGVLFFGHRVSAGGEKQANLIQDKYFAAFPFSPSLQPYEDVEVILPMGRFTAVEKSKVLKHLDLLLPWGQTPLYLSLYNAIQQSASTTKDGIHDIIIVSDGRNYQFNPHPSADIAIDSIIELAKLYKARIHLIGFGIPKAELAEASSQYQRLAAETGGSASFQVADSVALVDRVNSLSSPQSVTLQLPAKEPIQAVAGADIVLPVVTQNNTPLTIEYKGVASTFPISPKSALKLFVSIDNKFSSAQYTASGSPILYSLIDFEQNASQVQLGVHSPRSTPEGYLWDLSLIRADGGVAPRPKFHLVEIEPLMDHSTSMLTDDPPKYVSFNSNWLPDTPHPVLQVHTKNWPEHSDSANLQFWCTDETPPLLDQWVWNDDELAQSASLHPHRDLSNAPRRQPLVHDVPPLGIKCHAYATSRELVLVIFHESDQLPVEDILPLVTLGTAPERTERDYRPHDKMSIHRFYWPDFKGPSFKSQKNNLKIALLNLRDMKKDSIFPIDPINLQISRPMTAKPISPAPVIRR